MSIEMEIPKVLWLKNNMPKELFDRCKFYDLTDALTHMASGNNIRRFSSTFCKQGFVPVVVDGSVKGWQGDFLEEIGLGDLVEDNFKRLGGVNGEVSYLYLFLCEDFTNAERMGSTCQLVKNVALFPIKQHPILACPQV